MDATGTKRRTSPARKALDALLTASVAAANDAVSPHDLLCLAKSYDGARLNMLTAALKLGMPKLVQFVELYQGDGQ